MAYNTKYRIEFSDINGKNVTVNIKSLNYQNEVIYIDKLSDSPLQVKVNGDGQDKYIPFKTSEVILSLLSEIDYQYFEFSSFEEKQYVLDVVIEGNIKWSGFLVPDNYREAYDTAPYYISMVATDYLSTLSDYDFTDAEDSFNLGLMKPIDIILLCLNKLELNIDLWDAGNVFPEGGTVDESGLAQCYVDTSKYIKGFGTETETPSSCKEVMEDILACFGLTLFQNNGHWELNSFDNFSKSYYVYNFGGFFLEKLDSDVIRQIDDSDLYLVKQETELEVEGAYRKVNLVHNLGRKNLSVRGGGFTGNDWISDNEHRYFTYTGSGGTFSRSGNRGYFSKQVDNTTYTGEGGAANTNVLNAAKADYLTMTVPFSRLPIPPKNIDYHLDLDFFTQLEIDYTKPPTFDDPSFDHETYENYLEQQTTQFFSNLVYGCFFQAKIVNTTTGITSYHRFNPTGMDGESNVLDNRWSYGSTFDDWDNFITDMINESGNIDPLKVKKKYNEADGSAAPANFINDDYEYRQRMQLYQNTSSTTKLIRPTDEGYIELKISAPYFFQVQNYHSGVPTDYQIDINRVYQYIRKVDFTNEEFTENNSEVTVTGDNDTNIRIFPEIKLNLGDGHILSVNSLFDEAGNTFDYWERNDVETSLLEHTANKIINQYSAPSFRLRGTIFTKDTPLSLSDVIYIENLDKYFVVNTDCYDVLEAQHKVELIELLGYSGFGNRQLSWIKKMAISLVDNADGYAININYEED
ncbi:hypothetical protein [Algoriphagus aquimarinus]|uniref:hypothetical protein n=1 Tax=Algoriphagus aquimarinus TaxID=237018 RepID=UPI0030DAFFA5|tara:strand:- start:34483 stop:36726 length:2244 start_codon:yes stop_codon:yes gene_type:complete